MIETPQQLSATVEELTQGVWTLAAIATLFESPLVEALAEPRTLEELAARFDGLPRERIQRCLDVAALRGIVGVVDGRYQLAPGARPFASQPMRSVLVGEMRTALMQPLAYVDAASRSTPTRGWHHTDRRVLQAQGDSSAGFPGGLAHGFGAQLGDLLERLAKPTARFLDVGVGVASLSIAMCRNFPQVEVVGLDVFDVPLAMARDNVARAGLADRIELRQLALEDLREEQAYDLIWIPACFIAPSTLDAAIARAVAALRPGGWVLSPAIASDAPAGLVAIYSMVLEQWGATTDTTLLVDRYTHAGLAPRVVRGPAAWLAMVAAQRV